MYYTVFGFVCVIIALFIGVFCARHVDSASKAYTISMFVFALLLGGAMVLLDLGIVYK